MNNNFEKSVQNLLTNYYSDMDYRIELRINCFMKDELNSIFIKNYGKSNFIRDCVELGFKLVNNDIKIFKSKK